MNAEDEITELKKRVELLEARFKRPVPEINMHKAKDARRVAVEAAALHKAPRDDCPEHGGA